MKKMIAVVLLCCIWLTGCADVFDGEYSSVKPHQQPSIPVDSRTVSAKDRDELYDALAKMVESGEEEAVISIASYDQSQLEVDMRDVRVWITNHHPIGAYAVDWISFKQGKSEGQSALTVYIHYIHDRTAIRNIQNVNGVGEATRQICMALEQFDVSLVLKVRNYEETDLVQIVENYAMENPHLIMETPQVSVNLYPDSGQIRVIELRFTYETSRDSLRSMQEQVEPVFHEAVEFVSGEDTEREKYSKLFEFLMGRFDYQIATSITPPYSLLQHGVGDSRSFAQVFSAMCRQAGLECRIVSGTKDGVSHYWNIICEDDIYYHLDLMEQTFRERADRDMAGYVWDYSAYPACGVRLSEGN